VEHLQSTAIPVLFIVRKKKKKKRKEKKKGVHTGVVGSPLPTQTEPRWTVELELQGPSMYTGPFK
jgi:hypothetical protein